MHPILFQDDDVLAVDKPEGLASIPERDAGRENVQSSFSVFLGTRLFVVHRLDKEVSGVLLFAKNEAAHRVLCRQFEQRQVHKTYVALVHGVIEEPEWVIDRPIRQFGSGRMAVDARGKESITRFTVVRRFRDHSLINAEPETGRRHQLRVHFYSIGHAIAGDPRYGDIKIQERYARLMLHATRVEFSLPSGKAASIESPLPESFLKIVGTAGQGAFYPR